MARLACFLFSFWRLWAHQLRLTEDDGAHHDEEKRIPRRMVRARVDVHSHAAAFFPEGSAGTVGQKQRSCSYRAEKS